jgi:glycolate oxidase FAD binding subunit
MGKLLTGSFGTLAAIASINFKLIPLPLEHRTFALNFNEATTALVTRDRILKGVLQPAAVDLVNPAAAALVGQSGFTLLLEAGGNNAMMSRYEAELGTPPLAEFDWEAIREFTPRYLAANPAACVARVSSTLTELAAIFGSTEHPVVARAANGVSYINFPTPDAAVEWADRAEKQNWRFVFEYGMQRDSAVFSRDFAMMGKVKDLFDPLHLLNPGRMYGRI